MGETARHRYLKQEIRSRLIEEYALHPEDIIEEYSHTFHINLNGSSVDIPYRADLFVPSKKIWVEIGLIDPTKRQVLSNQTDFEFRLFPYGRRLENLPSEYHQTTQTGRLTFQKMTVLLKELATDLYDSIKIQPSFNVKTPPLWDASAHELYHAPLQINSDYFNLPLGSLTDEERIRERQLYCGIAVNALGKYSVFVEAANTQVIMGFMKKDLREVCESLNKLKLANYDTTAGFGYLLRNKKVRPYYFSWAYLKPEYTDWFGNVINPTLPDCALTYNTRSITVEDFEEIGEYFDCLLSSNFRSAREYNRYPRLSLVKAENLKKDEVLPILLEIGNIYSLVKDVRNVEEIIEDAIISDVVLLEAYEQHDEEKIIEFLKINYPSFEGYPKRSRKLSSAIRDLNRNLEEKISDIDRKGFEICSMLNKGLLKKEVYDKLDAKLCSYDKFRTICEKLCK